MCLSISESILESVCEYFTLVQLHRNQCLISSELVSITYHPFSILEVPYSALF